jgi:hypothetical protein
LGRLSAGRADRGDPVEDGKSITLPLVDSRGGAETVELYPELEAELARTEGAEREMIVRDERTGKAYGIDYMQKLHKRIPGNAERAMPAPRRTVTRRAPREPARLQARAVEP